MGSGDNTNNEIFEVFISSFILLLDSLKFSGIWKAETIQIMKH